MAQDLSHYVDKYGEVINAKTAAKILGITKKGFDSSLYGTSPDFEEYRKLKTKVGRRIVFPTRAFFSLLLGIKDD